MEMAIIEEMQALEKNEAWDIMAKLEGKTLVGYKWIFMVKYKANGSIERYKAMLVAKGYTQTYGIDYQEMFAPVAQLNTIRVLLSLTANLDQPLQQLDVKNVFLNGDLEEEVHMDLPLKVYLCATKSKVLCLGSNMGQSFNFGPNSKKGMGSSKQMLFLSSE